MLVGVTTSKGRLGHILRTLPGKLAELDALVVVDYGCPERTAAACESLADPRLFVVRIVEDVETWNPGRARNRGLELVRQTWGVEGARVAFADADTELRPGFGRWAKQLPPRAIGCAGPTERGEWRRDLFGLLVVDAVDFEGYDETAPEYGYEDTEARWRLWNAGLDFAWCPADLVEPILHSNRLRLQWYPQPSRESDSHRAHVRHMAELHVRPGDYPGWHGTPARNPAVTFPLLPAPMSGNFRLTAGA